MAESPDIGTTVMQWADALARHSDHPEHLTVAYLTPAHRAAAQQLLAWMREAGFDEVFQDAVGNVVGRYRASAPKAKTLITGSHFDTVRNGGKYDGRLGILLPIAVVKNLRARGQRPPITIEVVGFSEEEGVRFKGTFLGSSALAGTFDQRMLDAVDADGVSMRQAMTEAGLNPAEIPAIARDPKSLAGFIEVHIEQGPVLLERGLPLGVVSSINGCVRMQVQLTGVAGHAGTTPMSMRADAAAAAAEITLLIESRCKQAPTLVGTVGMLNVPDGSINVIPGACHFSIDIRAADDKTRDAALDDVTRGMREICARRKIEARWQEVVRVAAVPCDARLRNRWSDAIRNVGQPVHDLPSGAGHDAMKMADITPVAMLFTRCGNGGISHNPREIMTAEDAAIAGQVLMDVIMGFS